MKHLIITAGDPLGVGPEALVKAIKKLPKNFARITVIGDEPALRAAGWQDAMGTIIAVQSLYKKPVKRGPSAWGGDISYQAVIAAIALLNAGRANALVTAPISKEAWQMAGVKFTGHTEVFKKYASAGKNTALMMFESGPLCCALVTEHLALKDLPGAITKPKIKAAARLLAAQIGPKKLILISALNPHAGDGGKLGREEISIIAPAIGELQKEGLNVAGPAPVDAAWAAHKAGAAGALLLMQHDAALLGIKLAAGAPVVHITAGLRWLRTSPAHGTAFDIAGQNKANAASMLAAIKRAAHARHCEEA